jgi:hypothetical protein
MIKYICIKNELKNGGIISTIGLNESIDELKGK